jgi:hypothetical protein
VERDTDGRLLVVADTELRHQLLILDRVDVLGRLPQSRFHLVNLYDEFRHFRGDGESASLAVAVKRRWVIAADEKGGASSMVARCSGGHGSTRVRSRRL